MEEPCPYAAYLCLEIKEGQGFSFAKKPIVIGASFLGVQLYHVPVEPADAPLFNACLSWAIPEEIVKKVNTFKTPIRVDFFYHPVINRRGRIGFLLVDIKKACNTIKGETPIFSTQKVSGLSGIAKTHSVLINLSVSIRPYEEDTDEPSATRGRVAIKKRRVFCNPTTIQTTDYLESKAPNVCLSTAGELTGHFVITFEILSYSKLTLITSKIMGSAKEDEVCIMFSAFFHKFCFRDVTGIKGLTKSKTLSINVHANFTLFTNYFSKFPSMELKMVVGDKFVGITNFRIKDLIPTKKSEESFKANLEQNDSEFVKKKLVIKPNSGYGSPERGESTIEFLVEVRYKGTSVQPLPDNTLYALPPIPDFPTSDADSSDSEAPPHISPPKPSSRKRPWRKRSKNFRRECLVKKAVKPMRRDFCTRGAIGHCRRECCTRTASTKSGTCCCSERYKRKHNITDSTTDCYAHHHDSACEDLLNLVCNQNSNIPCGQPNFPQELFDCGLNLTPRSDVPDYPKPCLHYSLSVQEADNHPENNRNPFPNSHPLHRKLDITLKDSLANHKDCVRDVFTHICAELEDWKERQQEIFRFQLKKNTERHIQKLAHSWMKKQKVVEEDLTKRMQRCMSLTNSLSLASEELAARTQIVIKKEGELKTLKDKLNEEYNHKFSGISDASKRYQYDMDHKMALLKLERDELKKRLDASESERRRLEKLLDNNLHQEKETQAQMAKVMIDMKCLEEKLAAALESKKFFKEQWATSVREIHMLKDERNEFMTREIERSKNELETLGYLNAYKEAMSKKNEEDMLRNEIKASMSMSYSAPAGIIPPRGGEGEGVFPNPFPSSFLRGGLFNKFNFGQKH